MAGFAYYCQAPAGEKTPLAIQPFCYRFHNGLHCYWVGGRWYTFVALGHLVAPPEAPPSSQLRTPSPRRPSKLPLSQRAGKQAASPGPLSLEASLSGTPAPSREIRTQNEHTDERFPEMRSMRPLAAARKMVDPKDLNVKTDGVDWDFFPWTENEKVDLFEWLETGGIWELAQDRYGTRLLQSLLLGKSILLRRYEARMAEQLRDNVREAWCGKNAQYANHVLQLLVQTLPPSLVEFVLVEMATYCHDLNKEFGEHEQDQHPALHKFGCQVFNQVLSFFNAETFHDRGIRVIANWIKRYAEQLACHMYGSHVLQTALEHLKPELKDEIAQVVFSLIETDCFSFVNIIQQCNGSHVVQKAMEYASPQFSVTFLARLLSEKWFQNKSKQEYASFVKKSVKKLLARVRKGDFGQEITEQLRALLPQEVTRSSTRQASNATTGDPRSTRQRRGFPALSAA